MRSHSNQVLQTDSRLIKPEDELRRHRTEVKFALGLRVARGSAVAHDYLDRVETARGKQARQKLEADVIQQWNLGNRGTTWIDPPVD